MSTQTKNKFAAAMKSATKTEEAAAPDRAVVTRVKPTKAKTEPQESRTEWKTPRTRKNHKAVTMYVSGDAHKALKLLAIEQDKTQKELMDEALSALFRQYGKTSLN